MRTSTHRSWFSLVIAVCISAIFTPLATITARERGDQAITVEVAPQAAGAERTIALDRPLTVVVANASREPIRVSDLEWSAGYQQLQFQATDGERTWVIRRKDRVWISSALSFWTLEPREPLVLSVTLTPDLWECAEGETVLPGGVGDLKGKTLTVWAVFASDDDPWSREQQVWSGRVNSTPHTYVLQ